MAHIHIGRPGVNGPIAVWLYPSTATAPGPTRVRTASTVMIAEGTITAANLVGPLAGQPSRGAGMLRSNGGTAYVNLHTSDGVGAGEHRCQATSPAERCAATSTSV